ncbi:MAG: hypothetical protein IPN33_23385 [Saprospiraceae bacterium]|nr:hypothetical protein [Saprospiraceae bacterium]
MRFYKPVALFVALLSAVVMYGQPAYRIADYMPMRLGDTLQLQNMLDDKLPPLVATYSDTLHFKGQFAFKRKKTPSFASSNSTRAAGSSLPWHSALAKRSSSTSR